MPQSLTARGGFYNSFADVAAAQTDSVLRAAHGNAKITVVAVFANAVDAGVVTFNFTTKPGGAGTAISPVFEMPVNGGFVLPFNEFGWFESNRGEGLAITTAGASAMGVIVIYKLS